MIAKALQFKGLEPVASFFLKRARLAAISRSSHPSFPQIGEFMDDHSTPPAEQPGRSPRHVSRPSDSMAAQRFAGPTSGRQVLSIVPRHLHEGLESISTTRPQRINLTFRKAG